MDNQPIVFNIQFTPYRLPKNATESERNAHAEERAFYDMTGDKNVYRYITTEGKRTGKMTALEYLQKNTGVFNKNGMIPQDEVDAMKERLKQNKGNIYHGFVSLNEENSYKIDTPEKCVAFVRSAFGMFLNEAHFREKDIDLMCALHLDKPKHKHLHFVFWEKEPKYRDGKGGLRYRSRGMIDKSAIDNLFVRAGIFVSNGKDRLYKTRDEALKELRGMTAVHAAMTSEDAIKKEVIALAKALPKTGRLGYGSEDMQLYRGRVDNIVRLLLNYDGKARSADRRFYHALGKRKREIENICGKEYAFANSNASENEILENLPKYHYKIDDSNIKMIAEIEADYKRRQGNLVLGLAKFIKPELYERKPGKRYSANDHFLKRRLNISNRNVDRSLKKFISSFGRETELLERDFTHRLQEIEEEMKRAEKYNGEENYKD